MGDPKVSIITAARIDSRIKEEWLTDAMKSVQSQSVDDWEAIIVDDCSPRRVKDFEDPRIRTVRTVEQSGPAICRNIAVSLSAAEALIPLDADDEFASPEVLQRLLDAWDPKKVIYGNLQRVAESPSGEFVESEPVTVLPEYSFEKSLDLRGVIPVTALHSKDCWQAVGGWKKELVRGIEDVDYWISAGAMGYCGQKIDLVVLRYRMHSASRSYRLKTSSDTGKEMRDLIRRSHSNLFSGDYPMSCCGGSGGGGAMTVQPTYGSNPPSSSIMRRRPHSRQAAEPQKKAIDQAIVWVEYVGASNASFSVIGQNTGTAYDINGWGSKIPVYEYDVPKFARSGRGVDFKIGIPSPEPNIRPPEVADSELEQSTSGDVPEMAMIERL